MRRRYEVELIRTGQVRVLITDIETGNITAEFWSAGETPAVGSFIALALENDARCYKVSVPRIGPEMPEDFR